MKLASLLALWCAAALLPCLPAAAPAQAGTTGATGPVDVNVVLRVSRKLVQQLTTTKIRRTTPIHERVLDSPALDDAELILVTGDVTDRGTSVSWRNFLDSIEERGLNDRVNALQATAAKVRAQAVQVAGELQS